MSTTELTATIVASYVERNKIAPTELESLIHRVYGALAMLDKEPAHIEAQEKATPAQIKRSIRPDALISFIDGRPYTLLRRHLTAHGLTPQEYRARFGLFAERKAREVCDRLTQRGQTCFAAIAAR